MVAALAYRADPVHAAGVALRECRFSAAALPSMSAATGQRRETLREQLAGGAGRAIRLPRSFRAWWRFPGLRRPSPLAALFRGGALRSAGRPGTCGSSSRESTVGPPGGHLRAAVLEHLLRAARHAHGRSSTPRSACCSPPPSALLCGLWLPRAPLHLDPKLGAVGLNRFGRGVAGWVEFAPPPATASRRRVGRADLPAGLLRAGCGRRRSGGRRRGHGRAVSCSPAFRATRLGAGSGKAAAVFGLLSASCTCSSRSRSASPRRPPAVQARARRPAAADEADLPRARRPGAG